MSDAALSSRDAVIQGMSLDTCLVWPKRSLTRESAGSACWVPFRLCTIESSLALKNLMQTPPTVAPESKGNTAARQFSYLTLKQTRNLMPELKLLKFNFSLISAKLWRVSENERGNILPFIAFAPAVQTVHYGTPTKCRVIVILQEQMGRTCKHIGPISLSLHHTLISIHTSSA